LASVFPPSLHPCCLKKIWARLFPPKLIVLSCSGLHESKFVVLNEYGNNIASQSFLKRNARRKEDKEKRDAPRNNTKVKSL
jgi:hypothetical protein